MLPDGFWGSSPQGQAAHCLEPRGQWVQWAWPTSWPETPARCQAGQITEGCDVPPAPAWTWRAAGVHSHQRAGHRAGQETARPRDRLRAKGVPAAKGKRTHGPPPTSSIDPGTAKAPGPISPGSERGDTHKK